MNSHTVTAVLDTPKEEVFDFLSQLDNLPRWATEFAHELRYECGRALVKNGLGEFVIELDSDADSGVIDMYAGPSQEELALFPTRVVGLPGGRCAYTFTMFQGPGMPAELFESQYQSLLREFENIRDQFS